MLKHLIYFCLFAIFNVKSISGNKLISHNLDHSSIFFIDEECEAQFDLEKTRCLKDAEDEWNETENRKKAICCSQWDYSDCVINGVKDHCDSVAVKRIQKAFDATNEKVEKSLCPDYPSGSYFCHFPIWLIILLSAIAVVILLSATFICIWHCGRVHASKAGYM